MNTEPNLSLLHLPLFFFLLLHLLLLLITNYYYYYTSKVGKDLGYLKKFELVSE